MKLFEVLLKYGFFSNVKYGLVEKINGRNLLRNPLEFLNRIKSSIFNPSILLVKLPQFKGLYPPIKSPWIVLSITTVGPLKSHNL
ncbi:hypothetical protein C2G38_2075204 [Gigaspora rosea]|uniref:Uncharacterized protein n=1 Tax=Gigaspora rosea TaxID=44941 RepID=A0A397VJD2_9GLOM|nr:hypothetical protein C2G38_2075204 [Gigaspora rosea]